MRIVIVGAGAVGSSLAERLTGEGQDVAIIEADREKAAEVQEIHDHDHHGQWCRSKRAFDG